MKCLLVLQVVFATETLAAGINMPARTTILDTLSRRRNAAHVLLQHNEMLQMAGRAGRRGFDTAGAAPRGQLIIEGMQWLCLSAGSVQKDVLQLVAQLSCCRCPGAQGGTSAALWVWLVQALGVPSKLRLTGVVLRMELVKSRQGLTHFARVLRLLANMVLDFAKTIRLRVSPDPEVCGCGPGHRVIVQGKPRRHWCSWEVAQKRTKRSW